MKKLSLYLFLILMISNVSLANSTLIDLKRRDDAGDGGATTDRGRVRNSQTGDAVVP